MSEQAEQGGYGQFCPVAMASEILCTRWTPLVLREMLCGSTRFNDLRRGLPRISPTLLSKRLKELTEAGVVMVTPADRSGVVEYKLTRAGEDLRDIVMSMGNWGQRWIESSLSLKNLDPSLLMWDMRRNLRLAALPRHKRCTVQFVYPEIKDGRGSYWIMVDGSHADLCSIDPGFEVDLYVTSTLRSMTAVWMGHTTLKAEIDAGHIELIGDKAIAQSMSDWLGLSVFAKEQRLAS